MRKLLAFVLVPFFIQAGSITQRIDSYILLEDYRGAHQELQTLLQQSPKDLTLIREAVRLYAAEGNLDRTFHYWKKYRAEGGEITDAFLEDVCWGVIKKEARSPQLETRAQAILGAGAIDQVRSVPILQKALEDDNAKIRELAVQIVSNMGDEPLKRQVVQLTQEDKNWAVRSTAIQAASKLKVEGLEAIYEKVVGDQHINLEEQVVAQQSMGLAGKEGGVETLLASENALVRQLGCCVIQERGKQVELLEKLLSDDNPNVRAQAFQALGLFRYTSDFALEEAVKYLDDRHEFVQANVAWYLLLAEREEGKSKLLELLRHRDKKVREVAWGALRASGRYGIPLAKEALAKSEDPYTRLNSALLLLEQREEVALAANELDQRLESHSDKWMEQTWGIFRAITPSTERHKVEIPNYPTVIDQSIRLKLLRLLAFVKHPGATESLRRFLKEERIEVNLMVAQTLLEEGDGVAHDMLYQLMEDQSPYIRLNAAALLVFWEHDEAAFTLLEASYPQAGTREKMFILGVIGSFKHERSVPFLVERLGESQPRVRSLAALAIIWNLNL